VTPAERYTLARAELDAAPPCEPVSSRLGCPRCSARRRAQQAADNLYHSILRTRAGSEDEVRGWTRPAPAAIVEG